MNSSLRSDFQGFIHTRLDRVEAAIIDNQSYQREQCNIEINTRELISALSEKQKITLKNIDDSYTNLMSIYEIEGYRQGFRDALNLIAGL